MKLVLSSLLTFVFLFSGCGTFDKTSAGLSTARTAAEQDSSAPAASAIARGDQVNQGRQQGQAAGEAAAKPELARMAATQSSEPLTTAPTERKVIQNGEFSIETKTPTEDQRKIAAIASTLGGFVVTSEFQQSSSSTSTVSVIVRVPAANFQKATEEIRKIGLQVLHEKLTGQDVTAEYIDLEARLRAKKALEAQYFEIMKRASKISDVLEVQQHLTEVRTEIEQAEGRRRYLENQSALSTINISLQTPAPLVAATQTGFWASIKNSFGDGVDVAVAIVLGIIHFVIVMLPIVVLILLPAGLIARVLWKRISWPKKEPIGIVPPTE